MIAGVLDYITERHPGSTLLGFKGGPGGILAKDFMEITQDNMVGTSVVGLTVLYSMPLTGKEAEE